MDESQVRRKACEECRRLKLKCDKKFPCHSCMRRGCAAICPEGQAKPNWPVWKLLTIFFPKGTFRKGTRSLKTNSLKLHETITDMSARIRQLEEALSSLQSQISPDPHPLLEGDDEQAPLARKSPPERPASVEENDVVDSLGAFSMDGKGDVVFHETTENAELPQTTRYQPAQGSLSLPPDLVLLSVLFPFPPELVNIQIDDFVPMLPAFSEALSLSDLYFAHSAWCQNPIPREAFMRFILSECYPDDAPAPSLQHVSSHRLSVLFMVCALGALMDTQRPLCSTEAEEYHTLARACLCIEPVYDNSTLPAVQSMFLMVWYYTLTSTRRTYGYKLAIWGVVIRLCQAIGLHHDTRKLHLEASDAKLRELVYWEVMCIDFWQASVVGRPPSISFNTADCKHPYDLRAIADSPADAEALAWWAWKHEFTYLLNSVMDQALRSKGSTYSQILTLDQKLRNHPVPSILGWSASQEALDEKLRGPTPLAMQCYMRLTLQESGLLQLHRRFFIQAIHDNPENPLQHQFGQSVRAVFNSACATLSSLYHICLHQPGVTLRFPLAWSHGFSAAILLSSLAISSPSCVFAQLAMKELERACTLFRDNAENSIQPHNATVILEEKRQKARDALEKRLSLGPAVEEPARIYGEKTIPPKTEAAIPESSIPRPRDSNSWPSHDAGIDWRRYASASSSEYQSWSQGNNAVNSSISPESRTE